MRKPFISIGILVLTMLLVMPVLAFNIDKHIVKNIQITSDPKYDRNPCLLEARDGTYWLFYTRGRDATGIRDLNGYNPDLDYYDIHYRTSKSLETLNEAQDNLLDLPYPDNAQRDVAAVQTDDGKIWLFASTGLGPGSQRNVYYYIYDGSWAGPTAIPETSESAAHIDALTYNRKIWLFFDYGYDLKVVSYDGSVWSPPTDIQSDATIAKAIIADGVFYVVWLPISGNGIYLSTSPDGTTWVSTSTPIASRVGGYNCDPVLVKDKKVFRLYWAPDIGTEQFMATSTSTNPTSPGSWSTPLRLTSASDWWDFWGEPYVKGGSIYLFYTSERNSEGTTRTDANIWMMKLSG